MNANRQRLTFTVMTIMNIIIGLMLYLFKKLRLEDVIYLFVIGTLVEFCLELSLTVPGIRIEQGTWSIWQMIVNTLIEFNMGIVLMFLLWIPIKIKRDKRYFPPLGYKDFKHIKTDFNLVAQISRDIPLNNILKKRMQTFNKQKLLSDLNYYSHKYLNKPFNEESFTIR
jgi:hypothetical protein